MRPAARSYRRLRNSASGAAVTAMLGVPVAAALGLMAVLVAQPASPAGSAAPTQELAALQRRTAVLERQVELARGKAFYLIFDPPGSTLTLMLRGARLQRYGVLGAQVGQPRVSWVRRATPVEWQGTVWSGGVLDPPRQVDRLVVQADEPGGEEAEPKPPSIPPTAEELYPVPPRYQIRFTGGVSIEVRPHDADSDVGTWTRIRAWAWARWHDTVAALSAADEDAIRLRLVLDPADAASLYRALPPDTQLLVLPGGLAAGTSTGPPAR